jgi:hypothetical protein
MPRQKALAPRRAAQRQGHRTMKTPGALRANETAKDAKDTKEVVNVQL